LRQYSFAKKLQSQTVSTEKLCKALLYEKGTLRMLMQFTPAQTKNLPFLTQIHKHTHVIIIEIVKQIDMKAIFDPQQQ